MPGIGRLDERVTLQGATETRGPTGGRTETWATVAEVWAARRDVRGQERIEAAQEIGERTAIWTIRWRADVTTGVRIRDRDGLIWDIHGIAEIGRRRWLELTATVRGAGV